MCQVDFNSFAFGELLQTNKTIRSQFGKGSHNQKGFEFDGDIRGTGGKSRIVAFSFDDL